MSVMSTLAGVVPGASVAAERLRSGLWPIPTAAAVLAGLIAALLALTQPEIGSGLAWWTGDTSSARGLLEMLAGSSLTVVALVFSLQVVALQLAASQYSPRVLRTYARDIWIQVSLAVLIATFVFCLMTLALFGRLSEPPRVSLTLAVVLGLASVAALLAVVSHIVSSLRVETMMSEIAAAAEGIVLASIGAPDVRERPPNWPPVAGVQGSPIVSPRAGFVQAVDRQRLMDWAAANDRYVLIDVAPGSQVLAGRELGQVWPPVEDDSPAAHCVLIGHERTPDEDPGLGLLQLVDVAVRALSPSVNDPTTAVHAIAHLASLAGLIAGQAAPGADHCVLDRDNHLRVVVHLPAFDDLLSVLCRPIVRSGAGHPEAMLAVVNLLNYVVECNPSLRGSAQAEAGYLTRAVERQMPEPADLQAVLSAADPLLWHPEDVAQDFSRK